MLEDVHIKCPKREGGSNNGRADWYPFYAGFSSSFAYSLIKTAGLSEQACIVDPWNGSGTTTAAAARLGYTAKGYDLNPVMGVIAKARLLSGHSQINVVETAEHIIDRCKGRSEDDSDIDPLETWIIPSRVRYIRNIEESIWENITGQRRAAVRSDEYKLCESPELVCFFYVAIFRVLRRLLDRFYPSNPTWIKEPDSIYSRIRPSRDKIESLFREEVENMASVLKNLNIRNRYPGRVDLSTGSSESLPLENSTVDAVLTSPPYCTRIDYAVATRAELAVIGYGSGDRFRSLRRRLIGTSTVPSEVEKPSPQWGRTCVSFLKKLKNHYSKASGTYYFKNHVQYFDSIFASIEELSRVLKSGGKCFVVVQDSYYKDIHNNLPTIIAEMAENVGMEIDRHKDFVNGQSMASVNPQVRKYRENTKATESVLCFIKK